MKPAPFDHHAPTTIDEAVSLLADLGDDAKVLAGGQSLAPMLALRLAVFPHLVDINGIVDLRDIRRQDGYVRVGAAAPDVTVEHHPEVASGVPLVRKASPYIGHFQIRNRGTLGGSLAHADPAAEYPAVALALEAEMEIRGPGGSRTVAAQDFFQGVWETAVAPDELLLAARFPVWEGRCGFGVREMARRHGDFALAGAVAAVGLDGRGRIDRARLALFGMGPTPLRGRAAEAALVGSAPGEMDTSEIGRLALDGLDDPPDDLHAPSWYRRRLGAAMAAGAWQAALEDLDA